MGRKHIGVDSDKHHIYFKREEKPTIEKKEVKSFDEMLSTLDTKSLLINAGSYAVAVRAYGGEFPDIKYIAADSGVQLAYDSFARSTVEKSLSEMMPKDNAMAAEILMETLMKTASNYAIATYFAGAAEVKSSFMYALVQAGIKYGAKKMFKNKKAAE